MVLRISHVCHGMCVPALSQMYTGTTYTYNNNKAIKICHRPCLSGANGFPCMRYAGEFCMSCPLCSWPLFLPSEGVSINGDLKTQRLDIQSSGQVGQDPVQMVLISISISIPISLLYSLVSTPLVFCTPSTPMRTGQPWPIGLLWYGIYFSFFVWVPLTRASDPGSSRAAIAKERHCQQEKL